MSYILDALRKADRDRGLRRVPTLGSVHVGPASSRRLWPWLIGGTIVLNLAAFTVMFRLTTATSPAGEGMAGPAVAPAAPAPLAPLTSQPPDGAVATTATTAVTGRTEEARDRAEPPSAVTPAAGERTAPPAPLPGDAQPARAATDGGARQPPQELKVEVLVYSADRAERAAWINGQRYTEGDRVLGTLVLEEIRRNAVILTGERGQRLVIEQ
jgi:general secretion pathway protein B